MKKVLFLMILPFLLFGTVRLNAQVTIGAEREPHPGAVLDLQSTKGLKLPVVDILDAAVFQLSADGSEAVGMIVYNAWANTVDGQGVGVYVWDGVKWQFVAISGGAGNLVTSITISADGGTTTLNAGGTLQLSASVGPATASDQTITWSRVSGSAATIDLAGLVTALSPGPVSFKATANDGSGVESNTLTLTVCGATTVQGYNVYCFPNNVGCWMTDNSKLGANTATTYSGKASGERGYYYSWHAACADACPAGYHLPTSNEFAALAQYLFGTASTTEKAAWFNDGSAAGYWDTYRGIWTSWDAHSAFWISDSYGMRAYSNRSSLSASGWHESARFPVRCVNDN